MTEDSYKGKNSDPLSLNLYTYANNNPITYSDPTGHTPDIVLDAAFLAHDVMEISKNPKDIENWAALIADGACAIIPIATGGGILVRNTDEGIKAGKALAKKIGESGKSFISKVKSAVSKGLNKFKGLFKGMSNSTKDLKVIGRLDDTAVAKNWKGHDVLNDPNWTLAKNDEWVNAGIKSKQDFYIASPMTEKNLVSTNPKYPGPTVFAREVEMLKNAGYVQKGDYFIHPSNLR